jgi:hypothetical protein
MPLAGTKRTLAQSNPKQSVLLSDSRSTRSNNFDFLQTTKSKRSVSRGRRVTIINTDTVGFNGSVPVPKPSLLFARNPASITTTNVARSKLSNNRPEPQAPTPQILLERQQLLAQKLQGCNVVPTVKRQQQRENPPELSHRSITNSTSHLNISSVREALLFESVRDVDLETTIAAQSRFASEADAEEYARSRRVVSELEQQEEKKEKNTKAAKAKESSSSSTAIQKEWYCQNCKRSTPNRPNICITKNHIVKVKRHIRTAQSTDDKRLELSNKSEEDGGLQLGSGLEWSRWNQLK